MSVLSDLLVGLATRVKGADPDGGVRAAVEDALSNNGLSDDAPAWLVDLVQALLDDRPTGRVVFPRDVMNNTRWDVTNALAELAPILGIDYDDYGEGIELGSPHIGTQALISREGPQGNYLYEVKSR